MHKSDKSKHNICIAAIKRKTIKPYDFKYSKFYELNDQIPYLGLQLDLNEYELIICSVVIDADNFSILTTQSLFLSKNGLKQKVFINEIKDIDYGFFKHPKNNFVLGSVKTLNGNNYNFYVETGNASMIMIYGFTILGLIKS